MRFGCRDIAFIFALAAIGLALADHRQIYLSLMGVAGVFRESLSSVYALGK